MWLAVHRGARIVAASRRSEARSFCRSFRGSERLIFCWKAVGNPGYSVTEAKTFMTAR